MNAVTLAGRPIAMLTAGVLLASGLVFVEAATPAPATAALPAGVAGFLVSHGQTGDATGVDMTPDSQHVAFASTATDLVGAGFDTNGVSDVFLSSTAQNPADPFSGAAVLISIGIGGVPANGASSEPTVSADGRYVAFTSTATNLVAAPSTAGRRHVYVRDVVAGTTVRIQSTLGEPDGDSFDSDFSADGRVLVFTSTATNLVDTNGNTVADPADDPNGASDIFVVDRGPDADSTFDSVQPEFLYVDGRPLPGATYEPAISGDGTKIAFTAEIDGIGSTGGGVATPGLKHVWEIDRQAGAQSLVRLSRFASQPAIDSSGKVVAFIVDGVCGAAGASVVASFVYNGSPYNIAIGSNLVGDEFGTSSRPAISANGQTITWQSTQPFFDTAAPPQAALPAPVVRVQDVPASDAWVVKRVFVDDVECSGIRRPEWSDLGVGTAPSISAAGRTISYSGPAPAPLTSAAPTTVVALDRHTNDGIDVSTTMGQLATPGMLAAIDTTLIPASEIRGYAAALANAPIHRIPIHRIPIHRIPIHRIPIHRIPIHRIPIHRIPIHRIPIHRIDIPGGWTELLVGTPFENQAPQTIIFGDVLDWAAKNAPEDSAATAEERAAAQRIQTLTLGDIELDDSGIDAMTLASLVLGNARLSQVHIAGADGATDTQRWQAVVAAQGLLDDQGAPLKVGAETVLAELDFAGLDISRTGVEAVSLPSLPISDTLLDAMPARSLILENSPIGDLPVSALTEASIAALWGEPRTGTIAQNAAGLLDGGTAADLARGVPPSITLGDFLFSVIDRSSFPWEQVDPASIDYVPREQTAYACTGSENCQVPIMWQVAFDPGPGEDTVFPSPLLTLELPGGSSQNHTALQGSGPGFSRPDAEYLGASVSNHEHVEFPFGDTRGGTAYSLTVFPNVTTNPQADKTTATLTVGQLTDTASFEFGRDLADYDDPVHNYDPSTGQWAQSTPPPMAEGLVYYGWISTAYFRFNEELSRNEEGPAGDEDYYLVSPPPPGKRLVVSTNAADGQVVMSLYSPSGSSGSSTLGVPSAGQAPGTPVTEQAPGTTNAEAESGADAGTQLPAQTLVDQASVGGSGTAQVDAAGVSSAAPMLLRISSGNGLPSDSLYSLRVQYVDEPVEQVCAAAVRPAPADRPAPGVSDSILSTTNTVYLIDSQRFDETYGAGTAATLRIKLGALNGKGTVGTGDVHGAVVSIDESSHVRAARDALLDANPCSMSARAALTAEINQFVDEKIASVRSQVTSIVIVGGDDIIPFAPVAQHTSQFNEASHAADLRREKMADGSACPTTVEDGTLDPCATPMSAAAATNYILTDDAYGLAQAYESLGGGLYVPTVGVGRLVETPGQIAATLARFVGSDGELAASSSLTAGYGAWSELPGEVTKALTWRKGTANDLGDSWSASQVTGLLKPAGTDALSPRVISLNAHADETRLLPGVPGAESGIFKDADLLNASSLTNAPQLAGAVVFTIGCHAGGNLPTAYYGDVPDWADVFSAAGGYVGNTGYGLASSTTTALSERLLALYADWIGVDAPNGPVSSAGALTYAKQSYLGGFGLYSGYDEKALMESVYYGLPMYTFKAVSPPKAMPLPTLPPGGFTQLPASGSGLNTASLSLSPVFQQSALDASGASYLTAKGLASEDAYQQPLVINGQPVLPSLLYQLNPAPTGKVARGALITELSSAFEGIIKPTVAQANLGIEESSTGFAGGAFPSVFAQVMHQLTPGGTIDTIAVTPGRVEMGANGQGQVESFNGLSLDVIYGLSTSSDETAPIVRSSDMRGFTLKATADGTGSPVSRGVLLVQQQNDQGHYAGAWTKIPVIFTDDDEDDLGPGEVDTTFVSSAITDIPVGNGKPYRWFLQVVDEAGNVGIDTSRGRLSIGAAVAPELATTDAVTLTAGERLLRTIEVTKVNPTDPLTAKYTTTDPLTAKYTITDPTGTSDRRGSALVQVGEDGKTRVVVDAVMATVGDYVVTVEVCLGAACTTTTFDLSVKPVKALPTIAAHPTNDDGAYAVDTWSRSAVTVRFDCAKGSADLEPCPDEVVVPPDTGADGVFVEGTVKDADDETASAGLRVKVDATPPTLAPQVTPASVVVGDAALAVPNASDAASGIASASCEQPDTSTPGIDQTVLCTATDKAGNTATATATYTVTGAPPSITAKATVGGVPYVADTWTRGPVVVTFTCTGGTPPIWCPGDETISETGSGPRPVVGEMRMGDFDTVVARTSVSVMVDHTPPTVKPTVPSPILQNQAASATANATDVGSGVLAPSVSCTPTPLDTSKVGTFPVSCQATDNVGNTSEPVTISYTVTAPTPVPAKCRGLLDRTALPPINADGSSVFLRTSGVPVVFAACDKNGNPISTKKFVKGTTLIATTTLPARTVVNELWYPPVQPFTFIKPLNVWTGNIATAKLTAGKKYTYRVDLTDGTSFTVTFGVR